MKLNGSTVALALLMSSCTSSLAFNMPKPAAMKVVAAGPRTTTTPLTLLYLKHTPQEQEVADDEIERLKSMAQKLRAEAAALEAERAEELAEAATVAFQKFDTNNDGQITMDELKAGLEKVLKTELPTSRIEKLMADFDTSGDGALQLDEFVGMDKFKNKLEALAREEKRQAREAIAAAQKEEELAKLAQARLEILNDKEPTTTDKIVSVLPYLFPLLDSVQFGSLLLINNADNPLALIVLALTALFRSIPFGGIATFIAFNFLSQFPNINKLVRYNLLQAIWIDIALFFPGLLGALLGLVGGNVIPPAIKELGSEAVFGTTVLVLIYCVVSSLLGMTPNKIPIISQAVDDRMPTIDMFDDQGRFRPRRERSDNEKDKKN